MDQASASLRLLYFARLREAFAMAEESVPFGPAVRTIADLRAHLVGRGGIWAEELGGARVVRFAVNQALAAPTQPLSAGDEVAVFPPVTGG